MVEVLQEGLQVVHPHIAHVLGHVAECIALLGLDVGAGVGEERAEVAGAAGGEAFQRHVAEQLLHAAELGGHAVHVGLGLLDLRGQLVLPVQRSAVVLVQLAELVLQVLQLCKRLVDVLLSLVHPVRPRQVGADERTRDDGQAGHQQPSQPHGATAEGHDGQHSTNVTNGLRSGYSHSMVPGGFDVMS